MEEKFWHKRWELGETAFHESEGNLLLKKHFEKMNLRQACRVFLPLCGKTKDILWLLNWGARVVGAELSENAVKDIFDELGIKPKISRLNNLSLYQAKNIDIFVGDIFKVSEKLLGLVDLVYDRAALVALPQSMRLKYTKHLLTISKCAPQLLITFEYKQHLMDGPPFSINDVEVKQHYETDYQLQCLETKNVAGGLKGNVLAKECVWLLKN